MMVRVDHVLNGLAGSQACRFGDHGQRSLFVVRRVDDRDVVLELDEQAVVRAAAEQPDTGGELLRLDPRARRHRRSHRVGNRHRGDRDVRLHAGDAIFVVVVGGVQPRVALMRVQQHRELHAAEVPVVRVRIS